MINAPVLKGGWAISLPSLKRGATEKILIKQEDHATSTFVNNLTMVASQHVCGRNKNHHFKEKIPYKPNRLSSTSQTVMANSVTILRGEKTVSSQ